MIIGVLDAASIYLLVSLIDISLLLFVYILSFAPVIFAIFSY